ncbi:MAG: bamD [Verrucomicrobiales bacterium]|nr:bamD [Verrucomicrobiales bacterium]
MFSNRRTSFHAGWLILLACFVLLRVDSDALAVEEVKPGTNLAVKATSVPISTNLIVGSETSKVASAVSPSTNSPLSTNLVPSLNAKQPGSQQTNSLVAGKESKRDHQLESKTAAVENSPSSEGINVFEVQLTEAKRQRTEKNPEGALKQLLAILQTNAPVEIKRPALLEMAQAATDAGQAMRAQNLYAQYVNLYPQDPKIPEIYLKQGILFRQMGLDTMAVTKFYSVMTSSLSLKLDEIEYYKKLVLQAQLEIADSYYLQAKFEESADFFSRLIKLNAPELNKAQIHYKLIRSLAYLNRPGETVIQAETFLANFKNSADVPEVRFVLAGALKGVGRNRDAMQQVLVLLQAQEKDAKANPETWVYWQQKAGNEIANQLFKEGDYLNSLEIYLNLSELNKEAAWQFPVYYQIGLIFEKLGQPVKAEEYFGKIVTREKEVIDKDRLSLKAVVEMARWRKDFISWEGKADETTRKLKVNLPDGTATNQPLKTVLSK